MRGGQDGTSFKATHSKNARTEEIRPKECLRRAESQSITVSNDRISRWRSQDGRWAGMPKPAKHHAVEQAHTTHDAHIDEFFYLLLQRRPVISREEIRKLIVRLGSGRQVQRIPHEAFGELASEFLG